MHNCRASLLSAIGAINVTISLCTHPGDLITKSPSIQIAKQVSDFYVPSIQPFISTSKKDPSTSDLVTMVPSRLTQKNQLSFFFFSFLICPHYLITGTRGHSLSS